MSACTESIGPVEGDASATVDIFIHQVARSSDPIDEPPDSGADWTYKLEVIEVWDGRNWFLEIRDLGPDQDNVTVNETHSFDIKGSLLVMIQITLYDRDDYFLEFADVSSSAGNVFIANYSLTDNVLWGDDTQTELGYTKTSGDFDGSTAIDENDAHIWFSVTDNYDPPHADAGDDITVLTGEKVNFDGRESTASPSSSITKYAWDFESDGVVDAEGALTSNTYVTKGTYIVTLNVTDSFNENDADTLTVTVANRPPQASFGTLPTGKTVEDIIALSDTSQDKDGTLQAWLWNFGDGTTSTERNPTHQYHNKGTYTITLTVTDNDGAEDTITDAIDIANIPPTADFTFTPATPKTEEPVNFTDTSTDIDSIIQTWNWVFGDAATSNDQHPSHTYMQRGTFTVELTVTDDENASSTVSQAIAILNNPPIADFTFSHLSLKAGEEVTFTDASIDPEQQPLRYSWNFGDESTSTSKNPRHIYEKCGTYAVELMVTDDENAHSIALHNITILNTSPTANFTFSPVTGTTDDVIVFTDTSTDIDGPIPTFFWEFGDRATSNDQHPTYLYPQKGTYTITLTVTDDDGGKATKTDQITINMSPNEVYVVGGIALVVIIAVASYAVIRQKTQKMITYTALG